MISQTNNIPLFKYKHTIIIRQIFTILTLFYRIDKPAYGRNRHL